MKIALYMTPTLTHGAGAEKYFINLARYLTDNTPEIDVIVVTLNSKWYKIFVGLLCFFYLRFDDLVKIIKGISIEREEEKEIFKQLGRAKWYPASPFEIRSLLNRNDIVYTKNEIVDLLLLKITCFNRLPAVIAGLHTPVYYPYTSKIFEKIHNKIYGSIFYDFLMKGVKKIHVVNKDDKQLMESRGYKNIKLIYYPFEFCNLSVMKNKTPDNKNFSVLFVGRISAQKGIDILLELINLINRSSIAANIDFTIAGSGDQRLENDVKNIARNYTNVKYVGHVNSTDIYKYYNNTDLVVIPSRYETVSYIALEAGCFGRVVVSSNISGPRDVIVDGVTGFLVEPKPEAFYEMIMKLYVLFTTRPSSFTNIGKKAKNYIGAVFNPSKITAEMIKLFYENI